MTIAKYRSRRNFSKTPEPEGNVDKSPGGPLHFVVQKHKASHLHFDFRLELDGVLKSWAVPKGPSMVAGEKRLAQEVEDHPLGYAKFQGEIPEGQYGAGKVEIWDEGAYGPAHMPSQVDRKESEPILKKQYAKGHLSIVLLGKKLKGEFGLIKAVHLRDKAWLLVKANDEYAKK